MLHGFTFAVVRIDRLIAFDIQLTYKKFGTETRMTEKLLDHKTTTYTTTH